MCVNKSHFNWKRGCMFTSCQWLHQALKGQRKWFLLFSSIGQSSRYEVLMLSSEGRASLHKTHMLSTPSNLTWSGWSSSTETFGLLKSCWVHGKNPTEIPCAIILWKTEMILFPACSEWRLDKCLGSREHFPFLEATLSPYSALLWTIAGNGWEQNHWSRLFLHRRAAEPTGNVNQSINW